jgi:hypothetical protein
MCYHACFVGAALSIPLALLLVLGIFLFTAREVSLYRADRRSRSEIYPYTYRRLIVRLLISLCMLAEIALLLVLPHALRWGAPGILKGSRSDWFILYVGFVFLLALGMVILALLDLRESRRLLDRSEERLYKEFLQELRQGDQPPELH